MIDEGYVKYSCSWQEGPAPISANDEILSVRDKMFALKLIGYDEKHGVGYGNISIRSGGDFIVSGTQTGHHPKSHPEHFCRVTDYHFTNNSLSCEGPIAASSESLTHAAIYELDPKINAVIHVHNKNMWETYLDILPSTKKEVPYGTPEMAREIFRLWRQPALPQHKILFMGGHEDGIISFGENLEEAAEILEYYLEQIS